jgi:hypothetical protein
MLAYQTDKKTGHVIPLDEIDQYEMTRAVGSEDNNPESLYDMEG